MRCPGRKNGGARAPHVVAAAQDHGPDGDLGRDRVVAARDASAAPETGSRLGIAEAQGPATRALTALHHNPAMLAGMPGTRVLLGASGGIDQRWIRRYGVGPDGVPTTSSADASRC